MLFKREAFRLFRILFSAIVLLIFTAAAARAAETLPGDACGTAPYVTNV